MTIKIGDKVSAYNKHWIVNSVTSASAVNAVLPDVGKRMEELNLTTLIWLDAESATTVDLGIMRIHGQRETAVVFTDESGNFHDPDKIMPDLAKQKN